MILCNGILLPGLSGRRKRCVNDAEQEEARETKDKLEFCDAARHAWPIGHAHNLSRYRSGKGVLICAQD